METITALEIIIILLMIINAMMTLHNALKARHGHIKILNIFLAFAFSSPVVLFISPDILPQPLRSIVEIAILTTLVIALVYNVQRGKR